MSKAVFRTFMHRITVSFLSSPPLGHRSLKPTLFRAAAVCCATWIASGNFSAQAATPWRPLPARSPVATAWAPQDNPSAPTTTAAGAAEVTAEQLATSASNAQNNSDFAFAEKQWGKLIESFPTWPQIATAKLNRGICLFQQNKYSAAIEPIKAAVVAGDQTLNIPKALLFLGFAQMKYGDELATSQSAEDREKKGMYLTTATQTLGKIYKEYPDYQDADQAIYFQAQAFYKLERYEEAIATFESLETLEDAKFRNVARYDLATAWLQLGDDVAALGAYQQYRAGLTPDDTVELDDVDLQIAKLNMKMAAAATDRGAAQQADQHLQDARASLQWIVTNSSSPIWAEASFNQAIIAGKLGDFKRAATLFDQIANAKPSPYKDQAALFAGRAWIGAKDYKQAIKTLTPITNRDSPFGLQAVIPLANALRNDNRAQEAQSLTEQWMKKSADDPLYTALLMERAEALFSIPGKKKLAAEQFLRIASESPQAPVAAEALYNATAAFWESFETESAIETANLFLENHPQHPLATDVQEILGDAFLVQEKFALGERVFRKLADENAQHARAPQWALRSGWAMYLQQKYDQTEAWLLPYVASFESPQLQSEALHWIGASQYQQKKYERAIVALTKSIDAGQRWQRIDETMLLLLRCQIAVDNLAEARRLSAELASRTPATPAVAESLFRIGESLYEKNEFVDAISQYDRLLTKFPESEFVPPALFGKGWSLLRSGKFELAESTFTQLIDQYPTIGLAEQARMGRSVAHRKLGKSDEAIGDLETFLTTAPEGARKITSQFELGLAYVENENWSQAEALFRDLLKLPAEHRLADRVRYELAWVLQSQKKLEQAEEQFRAIGDEFPNSRLAGDANFKVASALYDRQQYEEAKERFQRVLQSPDATNPLSEKARYKLGWCFFKLNQFVAAGNAFKQQIESFPDGALIAEGSFMLAQALFEQADYDNALNAYASAQTILMQSNTASERLKWITRINGAKSANQQKQFQQAIDFATPLTTLESQTSLVTDAWFEIGKSHMGLDQTEKAMDAWGKAAMSAGKTGAHARVLRGDVLFQQKQFDEAIDEFKLVFYGYGGSKADPEIRPLQAYAIYEAARCSYSRISAASQSLRRQLIADAENRFEYLIENYPDQELAKEAKKQLATLQALKSAN